MDNEILTSESQQENVSDNMDYIEAIKEMKNNTVAKEDFLRLKEENKKLLQSLINGDTIDATSIAPKADINQLRKDLYGDNMQLDNLQYIKKSLELREALLEQNQRDPFLPYGHDVLPTDQDVAAAERVANILSECVEEANGDSNVFTSLLNSRMVDSSPLRGRK